MKNIIPQERIESKIFMIRGQKAMLDVDLAVLYGVKTRTLNQAVKRNAERFPEDFMFQLTWDEVRCLRSQIVILKDDEKKRGKHIKYLPYAFTEQGIAMLSSVLRSKRAIQVNIMIMRTFIKLKQMIATHKELAYKIEELERKYKKHDHEIDSIFNAIKTMLEPPKSPPRKIGFQP